MHVRSECEKLAWQTEIALFGKLKASTPQIPMWLDLMSRNQTVPSDLVLKEIANINDWGSYKRLRTEIEIPFGVTSEEQIDQFLEEIQQIISKFPANWFLAYNSKNQIVGSIGLVAFEFDEQRIGRLQDVDIAPSFQKNGYGNQLLLAVMKIARAKG